MKRGSQFFKEICLVVGGTLIAIFAEALKPDQFLNRWIILGLAFLFIILGFFGFMAPLKGLWFCLGKSFNRKSRKIAIYAPFENKIGVNSTWIGDLEIREFSDLLQSKGIRNKRVTKESVFDRFPIVINPYGGVYPEEDLSTLASLDRVFDFVRKGGIYINIADIPFYYAYEKMLNRRVDTTPLSGIISAYRSFDATLLTSKLHCLVRGLDEDSKEKRLIQVPSSEYNLLEEKRENEDYSPVVKIPYGKGYFIFSTLQLNRENLQENIIRVVKAAIAEEMK
jgi:hypothetical protein